MRLFSMLAACQNRLCTEVQREEYFSFNGTLYFLNSNLNYEGNSTNNGYTIIIADTLSVLGTSVLGDNYTSLPGGISPIHSSVLVE